MTITPEEFEATLRKVLKDETSHLATKDSINTLQTSVDGLAKKVDAYLDDEWKAHNEVLHPHLLKRIVRIERKLGLEIE